MVGYGNSGIYVYMVAPGTTTIINNTCNSNNCGISLKNAESSTVAYNTCHSNTLNGISLENSGFSTVVSNTCNSNDENGIYLSESDSSTVANNTCNNNFKHGVILGSSDHNSIVWNVLFGNRDYGIVIYEGSDYNFIHHNSFIMNGLKKSQACDDGTNNKWYDETALEGNSWSDYADNGSYLIAGSAGNSDLYPSLSPYRYTSETNISGIFSLLVRFGLFLGILGLLGVSFFLTRQVNR